MLPILPLFLPTLAAVLAIPQATAPRPDLASRLQAALDDWRANVQSPGAVCQCRRSGKG